MVPKRRVFYIGLALTAGAAAFMFFLQLREEIPNSIKSNKRVQHLDVQQLNKSVIHLFFADKNNLFLISDKSTLSHADDPTHLGRKIIEALLKGPPEGFARTIPVGTSLRALYVTAEGICYVDLTDDIKEKHPGGVQSELLTIYSVVNSLILNVPEIKAVKILIGGNEATTLVGHIDLQNAIKANMLLIR
jgi:spore germination protein GerM